MQILWYFCYGFAPRLVRHPFLYGEVPEGAGVKNMYFIETYMKDLLKQWGKHVVALILFLGLVMTYFSPAVFDGKVIMQGDNIKAPGMGSSQMDQYAETAQPGEFSVWTDAMFGGMPYVTGYGQAAPSMPSYSIVDGWVKKVG